MAHEKITEEDVSHVANLSNLNLEKETIADLSKMFTETLDYMSVLDEIDTSKTQRTFQVTGSTNVFIQGDENKVTLSREEALRNGSEIIDGMFTTKAVFERS